LIRTSRIFW